MRTDALVSPMRRWAWLLPVVMVLSVSGPLRGDEKSSPTAPTVPTVPTPPTVSTADANDAASVDGPRADAAAGPLSTPMQLPDLSKRENLSSAMQIIVLLTVLSLAPAILIMMTSFTRIIIVLSLLRQALGTQQLPPNQILIGLALFMTFLVMRPTWDRVNNEALRPYLDGKMDQQTAFINAQQPIREFMIGQIHKANNEEDVLLFTGFANEKPTTWGQVTTMSLIPAFMLSELKTAFSLGFRVYLPFLVIDMVISTVLISMGMMMLPPSLISLPFKLLLFVLVDGWRLITMSLMVSFS
ncbi:MAG TPA: flagellar type III secretion system pore protein FliP [Tepidisphaeraceae bacterium]|nr:flagellar type III secretion system pore protein FliP [Tepidisphaeraceae bacterium]